MSNWLKYTGKLRDERLSQIRADLEKGEDCREHVRYLMELVKFMRCSMERHSDGLD
mgnify:CR=1 FL=1